MFDRVQFATFENYFLEEHTQSFELLLGKGPVMISAPHSVEQVRHQQKKLAEPQTGALAKMLHAELNCPVIYKTKNCNDDANFDEISPYKQALAEYIKNNDISFLLDLHQLAPSQTTSIAIGTGYNKNISQKKFVDIAIAAFHAKNIQPIGVDTPFAAAYPLTVSSYIASTCKISCLQIEINSNIVRLDSEKSQTKQVFDALVELINNLSIILREDTNEKL